MLYLTGQILLIVVFAAFVGLALGWWSRGLMADMHEENANDDEVDPFGARSRLEQCHRDNAELRRELKETQEQVEQLERTSSLTHDEDVMERLQAAESRADALMEDLQLRDDTIAVLEGELEKLR
ncbi:MAG: hypothetical protein ACPG51_04545 [Thiolinea sp.]